ncbi:MAG: aminotransferase class V-fold PLP-dependent enzyme [Oscillospiraceae bacterium]|nr:aminotransferase class V-fold PLP-dependent enzyme [Oscillospiraceae bacterium]
MIYLDHAATTPVLPQAAEIALEAMTVNYGNPSSLHAMGVRAAQYIHAASDRIARAVGCTPDCIIYTSGGTASNALVFQSVLKRGGHIVSTALEHPSVTTQLNAYKSKGFTLTIVPPTRSGGIDPEEFAAALTADTVLVNCTAVCSENGSVPDTELLFTLAKERSPDAWVHCDAVQAFGKIALPKLPHTLSISGHKIGAPKGIGAIVMQNAECRMQNLEPRGTENVSGIAAFGVAVDFVGAAFCRPCMINDAMGEPWAAECRPYTDLKNYALQQLRTIPNLTIIPPHEAPHIIAFALPPLPGEVLVRKLSDKGVYISSGTACNKGKRQQLLVDMKLPPEIVTSALRISFGCGTMREDIDGLVKAIKEIK